MTNHQLKPINRGTAFWIGLAVHLLLGSTLYYHTQGAGAGTGKTEIKTERLYETPVVP